ncbi:MAG TPA: alpha/beta hydrolase [Chitinophagaceae bacterium]|nr:alpha/beta hydrolase [Chitinophagaceae bacterium]
MASTQSKLFNLLLSIINKRNFLRKQLASGRLRYFEKPKPTFFARRNCRVTESKVGNRNVFTLAPKHQKNSGVHILYLHGGAYAQSFVIPHWNFMTLLVKTTGCTITAPDYPLVPDHTYKESFAMTEVLYRDLLSTVNPKDIIFMGDSSGGGFALALAQKMRNENIPPPGQIILLSPWLDATLTNPGMKEINGFIPFAGIEMLQQIGKKYAGDAGPEHYLISPINESLEGLGTISVFIGSKDILVADARKLRSLAASKGIEVNYFEYEDMFHGWMLLNFPEARKAQLQIIDLVNHS